MKRRAYFDAEPRYQKEAGPDWYRQNEAVNQALREALGEYITAKKNVMEVGCGGGWLAEHLLKTGVRAYSGFDFSETAVTRARRRLEAFEEAKIWRGDALSPANYSKKYDCIVAHQFLQCLIGPHRAQWLALCKQSLYAESVLLISTTVGMPAEHADAVDPVTKQNKLGNRYFASEEEVKAEILAAGLEVEEVLRPDEQHAIFVAGPKIN
jgi:2-polyprenyl-3-methyl-5-hydroxy-6-metoxy-1,4-benzoquinol methylase